MTSPIDIASSDARLAYIYARRFNLGLRAPDALHLAMARRLDATFVTLDRRLATAARELGVAVEHPHRHGPEERSSRPGFGNPSWWGW
jgi:predicted nucleic acid-binding protein